MSITSVKNDILTRESVINAFTPLAPTISSYNILVDAVIIDDTAVDTAGGQTIQINGTSFAPGAIITLDGSAVTTAYVSPNKLTFTAPVKIAGTYAIYVVNLDGGTAIYIPGIVYSGTPVWTTASGSLGSIYETNSISTTALVTTGDATITYSLYSGTLPTGSSLNTSTGVITGTAPVDSGSTVYSFTIKATDAQLQDSLQNFTLTINTDTVTWSTPAAGSTTTISQNANSTTTLLASSAAGKSITYSSTTLPTGLSISGATVIGTPTVLGTTATTFTATAATTGRTTTAVINWTISVANDVYFMYTPLLLSGGTATETFIADASTNNFALTIAGDTKPNNFNPYTPSYYSNYFDGSGDYLSVAAGNAAFAFGTGDFTVELWVYPVVFGSVSSSAPTMVAVHDGANSTGWQLYLTDGSIGIRTYYNNVMYLTASMAAYLGVWTHIAYVRSSGTQKIYMNGVEKCSTSTVWNWTDTALRIASQAQDFNGYFSNVRLVKGTALYTAAFTPPTAPLTAISGTSVLTCQSNRFIDNSTNAFTIAVTGNSTVNPNNPFVPNTAYAAYGSTYFDGTGDYLSAPSNAAFTFGTGAFTIEAWIYPTVYGPTTGNWIYSNLSTNSGNSEIGLILLNAGTIRLSTWNTAIVTSTLTAPLNVWSHVVGSFDGTTYRLFVNGVLSGTSTTVQTLSGTGGAYIGTAGPSGVSLFTGYLSNLRIVKGVAVYTANFTPPATPLSATQSAGTNIAAITGSATSLLTLQTNQPANNSMFLDSSTNAFAVTRAGNTSAGTGNPYGANWSNYFDGTGQAFYNSSFTGTNFGTSNFTIEMWVLWSASAASNQTVFELTGTRRIIIGRSSTGIRYFNDGTERGYTVTVPVGTWNHIAIVRVSNTTNIYLNGVSGTSFVDNVNWAETQFYVGRNSDGVELTSAMYLSNLRVVNGTAVYTSNFAIPTAPLTAISGTTLLICKSNSFIDNSANAFGVTLLGTPSVQRFSPFAPQTQTANTHSVYYGTKTDYISTPATTALTTFTGDFTFECWVNPTDTSLSTNWGIWDSRQDGQTASGMIFTLQNLASPVTGQWRLSYYYYGTQTYGTGTVLANQWTHVAFVRSGSTLTYYVNGVAGGTATVSGTQTGSATSNPVYIGTKDGSLSGYGTVGYISNFRIVKGVAVYTGNFTVPTSQLTATQSSGTNIAAITGTQTSLLTFQSPTLIDNSTNAFVLTPATTTVKPRTYNPLGFTNTLAGYSAAVYGGSAYFDGTGDYLSAVSNPAFALPGNFTYECWFNSDNTGTTSEWMEVPVTNGFQIYYSGTQIWVSAYGVTAYIVYTYTMPVGTWNHLAVVRNGTGTNNLVLYINGVSVATGTTNISFPQGAFRVGGTSYTFKGYISNARLVNGTAVYTANFVPPTAPLTAITNTSLLLNMTSSGVYDSASTNNLETVGDAKLVATQTPYAGSYYSNYFDGTGDVFTVSNNSGFNFSSDFIIEAWLYPTAFGQASCNFMTHWSSGSNVYVFRVLNTARLQFLYTAGATTLTGTSTTVSLNQWSHVAVCRSGSTLRIFVNGIADTTTATYSGTLTGGGPIAVGAHNDTSEGWTGYISNLRVVNTPSAPYTTTFTPSTTPLTSITGTALLTCQSNRFLDNSANAGTITKSGNVAVQSFNPFQRNSAATMYFDGTGDYLIAPQNAAYNFGTGDFTIEGWYYLTAIVTEQALAMLGTGANGGGPYTGWWLRYQSLGQLNLYRYDGTETTYTFSTTLVVNTWYHIACTRSGTSLRMFVNGAQVGTTATSSLSFNNVNSDPLQIGKVITGQGTFYYNGYINDLRITKGVARYTTTFTPPTSSPLAY